MDGVVLSFWKVNCVYLFAHKLKKKKKKANGSTLSSHFESSFAQEAVVGGTNALLDQVRDVFQSVGAMVRTQLVWPIKIRKQCFYFSTLYPHLIQSLWCQWLRSEGINALMSVKVLQTIKSSTSRLDRWVLCKSTKVWVQTDQKTENVQIIKTALRTEQPLFLQCKKQKATEFDWNMQGLKCTCFKSKCADKQPDVFTSYLSESKAGSFRFLVVVVIIFQLHLQQWHKLCWNKTQSLNPKMT